MRTSKILLGVLFGASTSLFDTSASACSPPYVEPSEPCDVVRIWIPGDTFPLNLADTDVRVILESYDGSFTSQRPFDPALTLEVARLTDTGFASVDFTLGTMDGLLTDARLLQITDPVPGRYLVASPDHTCAAEPATFAQGSLLAEFELTEEAPLPAELGAASWLGESVADEMVSLGQGADCSFEMEERRIARSRFRLDLSEQALPWSQALRFGIEVDGVQTYGYGVGTFEEPGVVTFEYQLTCPADGELSPGPHSLRFLGQVDSTTISSSPVDFEHSCDLGSSSDDSGASDGGCSVGRGACQTGWRAVLPLLLGLLSIRRRQRRT